MYPILHWAGDSTVKQNNINSYPQTGIGQMFSLFLKKEIFIMNHAENGRSTKSFIDEKRLDCIDANIRKNDFLFIQFGHNDEKKEDPARYTAPYGDYQTNLLKFIETARKHEAFPVLITPLYRRQFTDANTLKENSHLDYPDAMKALAQEQNVPLIDLCTLSKHRIESSGKEATESWFMNLAPDTFPAHPEGKTDNTHLQAKGAVIFASMIADELVKLGSPYADILIPLEKFSTYASLIQL